jgi:hypothetical protein
MFLVYYAWTLVPLYMVLIDFQCIDGFMLVSAHVNIAMLDITFLNKKELTLSGEDHIYEC